MKGAWNSYRAQNGWVQAVVVLAILVALWRIVDGAITLVNL